MSNDDLNAALLAEASTALAETKLGLTAIESRMASLEDRSAREIAELRLHMDNEFEEVRQTMGTMNAHLDNIAREASIANAHHDRTNELLEKDLGERREERKRALDLEEARLKHEQRLQTEELASTREDKVAEREEKKEVRERLFQAASEAWAVFKQPLAYLIVAAAGYIAWYYFGAPAPKYAPPQLPQQSIESQAEADE